MTITRRWQSGFESNGTSSSAEATTVYFSSGAISSTCSKTGSYSAKLINYDYVSQYIPQTRQVRTGFHIFPTTTWGNYRGSMFGILSGASRLVFLQMNDTDNILRLYINSTSSASMTYVIPQDSFSHFGIDANINSSSGWAVIYKDGIEQMRFDGDTGNNNITSIRYGSTESPAVNVHIGITYLDDVFIDDTTGQGAPAVVPDRRFYAISPNAIGSYNDGTVSTAASSHYMYVDERPHNSDTDYILLNTVDQKETYNMTSVCPPTGFTFAAVIPFTYAKKTDAEVATELALLIRSSGSTDLEGSACNLGTSYSFKWERFTTAPSGGAWTQADIDGIEIGYQGEGVF